MCRSRCDKKAAHVGVSLTQKLDTFVGRDNQEMKDLSSDGACLLLFPNEQRFLSRLSSFANLVLPDFVAAQVSVLSILIITSVAFL